MDPRPAEQRQRWRLVVAREQAARDLLHRDVTAAWESGLMSSGLPLSMSETATPRPRITFAALAPVGVLGERELIDIVLTELVLVHDVRSAAGAAAPVGYRLVDLFDVWLSSPTLASLVTAGDYRVTVTLPAGEPAAGLPAAGVPARDVPALEAAGVPALEAIEAGIAALLAAPLIERVRTKGHGEVTIDIRPHVLALRLAGVRPGTPSGATDSFELWMRLRLGGEGGIGRPEEIVAALGDVLGRRLAPRQVTRERIVLADDPDA